jgi:predicted transport protein
MGHELSRGALEWLLLLTSAGMKMTARSAKWVQGVLASCEKNTGRSVPAWMALARKAKVSDTAGARTWAKKQGLSTVYANMVAQTLFPSRQDDSELLEGQYTGPKAALRPIYDAVEKAARRLGNDVEVMPRKSQVTFSRAKSFAVVRAASKDRIELALKLHGTKATARLVADARATSSDPSHVVALRAVSDVDTEVAHWLRAAYGRAG